MSLPKSMYKLAKGMPDLEIMGTSIENLSINDLVVVIKVLNKELIDAKEAFRTEASRRYSPTITGMGF